MFEQHTAGAARSSLSDASLDSDSVLSEKSEVGDVDEEGWGLASVDV